MVERSYIVAGVVVLAWLTLAIPSPIVLTPARADASQNSPTEMLQDGLDALLDRQQDLAAQLFQQLIESFPGTKEASRAERELSALSPPDPPMETAERQSVFLEPISAKELRMKFAVEAGDRVFFAENSAVIGGRARALLEHQSRWLRKRPELKVTIIGRSDDGVPADAARDIAIKRAEAVRDRLVANGVAATRIAVEGRGSRDPVATCTSALCQAQNRHAETLIGSASAAGIPGEAVDVSQ